jgi:hypothetical protein
MEDSDQTPRSQSQLSQTHPRGDPMEIMYGGRRRHLSIAAEKLGAHAKVYGPHDSRRGTSGAAALRWLPAGG